MAGKSDLFLEKDTVKLVGTGDSPVVDVRGENRWDVDDHDGDVRIGDEENRFAIGVSLAGSGRGTTRLRAKSDSDRPAQLKLGAGRNDLVQMEEEQLIVTRNGSRDPSIALEPVTSGNSDDTRLGVGLEAERGIIQVHGEGKQDGPGGLPGVRIMGSDSDGRPSAISIGLDSLEDDALRISGDHIHMKAEGRIEASRSRLDIGEIDASNGAEVNDTLTVGNSTPVGENPDPDRSPGTITVLGEEISDSTAVTRAEIKSAPEGERGGEISIYGGSPALNQKTVEASGGSGTLTLGSQPSETGGNDQNNSGGYTFDEPIGPDLSLPGKTGTLRLHDGREETFEMTADNGTLTISSDTVGGPLLEIDTGEQKIKTKWEIERVE